MNDFIEFPDVEFDDADFLAGLEDQLDADWDELTSGGDVDLWDHDSWPDPPF